MVAFSNIFPLRWLFRPIGYFFRDLIILGFLFHKFEAFLGMR